MGTASTSDEKNEENENNAHSVLVIRTKDSNGHLFVGEENGYYHNTKYVSFKVPFKDICTVALSLWDTPAIDFSVDVHERVAAPYYEYAHGLFCVYSPESLASFETICQKITWFYKNPNQSPFKDISKVSIMLIAHKTDEFDEKLRQVPQQRALKYATAMDIKFFEVSSSNSEEMNALYVMIAQSIYQNYGELALHHSKRNGSELVISSELQQNSEEQTSNLNIPLRDRERANIIELPSKKRSTIELPSKKRSTMEQNPVSLRFQKFIEDTIGDIGLYELFVQSHYDDIRMIEYFDENMLENEIKIKNQIHRKLFLEQCQILKKEIAHFRNWLIHKLKLRRYLNVFETNGLITLNMIGEEIKGRDDFELKLKILNKSHCKILWEELQIYQCVVSVQID